MWTNVQYYKLSCMQGSPTLILVRVYGVHIRGTRIHRYVYQELDYVRANAA